MNSTQLHSSAFNTSLKKLFDPEHLSNFVGNPIGGAMWDNHPVDTFLAGRASDYYTHPEEAAAFLALGRYATLLERGRDELNNVFSLADISLLLATLGPNSFETSDAARLHVALQAEMGWEHLEEIPAQFKPLYQKLCALSPLQSCALADVLERVALVILPSDSLHARSLAAAVSATGLLLNDDGLDD